MSYVGKILVVVQVVLSLLFMAFAGAVFSMHQNWQTKYNAEVENSSRLDASLAELRKDLDLVKQNSETAIAGEKARADRIQAENLTLDAENKRLTLEVEKKEAQREEQTGLAIAKQNEAKFRQQEAEKQRIENDKLRAALDQESAKVRDLQDTVFTRDVTLEELRKRFVELELAHKYLERIVAANNLPTDPDIVERMKVPPPAVEGLVIQVKKNRANRVDFVQISIGSDDGLLVGHEIDVIRLNAAEGSSDWLGRIEIVDVQPDTAVARVIQPAKNGIIQEGDTVVSRLRQPSVSLNN